MGQIGTRAEEVLAQKQIPEAIAVDVGCGHRSEAGIDARSGLNSAWVRNQRVEDGAPRRGRGFVVRCGHKHMAVAGAVGPADQTNHGVEKTGGRLVVKV